MPIICFALQCHLVFVHVYNSMKTRTVTQGDVVGATSMTICLLLYIPTGIAGYVLFRSGTPSDVLVAMSASSAAVDVGRACIAITQLFSYPLLAFVARDGIGDLLWTEGVPLTRPRFLGVTVGFIASSALVSSCVRNVGVVIGFTGSTAAILQVFLFPAALWWKLRHEERWRGRGVALATAVFGLVVGVVSTVTTALSLSLSLSLQN